MTSTYDPRTVASADTMLKASHFAWNGAAIEGGERVGEDSLFVKGFAQRCLGIDVDTCFADMAGEALPYVDRNKAEMFYRGNPLTRTKFFLTDTSDPVRIYNYTGFQYKSALNYRCYQDFPIVGKIVDSLNAKLTVPYGTPSYNHVIGTLYQSESDQIGFHADKTKSWEQGTGVGILSLGATREFHLRRTDDETTRVFVCDAGDLFLLGWRDNITHTHAVVPVKAETTLDSNRIVTPRLSLCFRNVAEAWSVGDLNKKVTETTRAKVARLAAKARKRSSEPRHEKGLFKRRALAKLREHRANGLF